MGKKKSVVLMTLLTIVIAVLCFITAFPSFVIPGTAKKWNPAVKQYDLGTDLGGGYYAYYYPEGVISASEYESDKAALEEALASAEGDEERETAAQNELDEYVNGYAKVSNLYFSTDETLDIVVAERDEDGKVVSATITPNFQTAFDNAVQAITSRYQAKAYSDYRVAVVDGYVIRVELPRSENTEKASAVLTSFAKTDELTLKKGGEVIEELKDSGTSASDLIKKISVKTMNVGKTAYLEIQFTKAGKEMLKGIKDDLTDTTAMQQNQSGSSVVTLDIVSGDETIASIYKDYVMPNNTVRVMPVDGIHKDYLQTFEILMESLLADGAFNITFELDAVRTFAPLYNENVLTLLYIALGVAILAMLVLPIVKMGRFGGVSAYATLSYLIVTALCFAFITNGVFEVSLGTVLIFLVGMVLVNVMQYHIYKAMKVEFDAGKTVESSVKGGYKKTLWTVVDVYAVALLAALALLIGASGLYTFALQAIICVVTAAFINLLWARFINFTYLSASKNKYKYFRFVREDDEDDE